MQLAWLFCPDAKGLPEMIEKLEANRSMLIIEAIRVFAPREFRGDRSYLSGETVCWAFSTASALASLRQHRSTGL
jgi:hypothetical protein